MTHRCRSGVSRSHRVLFTHTSERCQQPAPKSTRVLILQGTGEFRASLISKATAYHPQPGRAGKAGGCEQEGEGEGIEGVALWSRLNSSEYKHTIASHQENGIIEKPQMKKRKSSRALTDEMCRQLLLLFILTSFCSVRLML